MKCKDAVKTYERMKCKDAVKTYERMRNLYDKVRTTLEKSSAEFLDDNELDECSTDIQIAILKWMDENTEEIVFKNEPLTGDK